MIVHPTEIPMKVTVISFMHHRPTGQPTPAHPRAPLVVEATNSWWSNYGQLRRNTDRRNHHRHAALCLATAVLFTARLIDWRNRWNPTPTPIR